MKGVWTQAFDCPILPTSKLHLYIGAILPNVGDAGSRPVRIESRVQPDRHRLAVEFRRSWVAAEFAGEGIEYQPTLPSRLTPISFCASTANSIGSSRKTFLQKPLTIRFTASSLEMPRWLQ